MKKFLSLLLVLTLAVGCLFACGDDEVTGGELEAVAAMYAVSQPTKIVAITTHQFGTKTLNGSYELVTGLLDGVTPVATYTAKYEQMRDIASGSTQEILEPIEEINLLIEYKEGKGTRETLNGKRGSWNKDGESIIPAKGAIAVNLDATVITQFTYEDNTLTFTVPQASTESVLGMAIEADALVVIKNDGTRITGVEITYTEAADAATNVEQTVVSISVKYTYDLEIPDIA